MAKISFEKWPIEGRVILISPTGAKAQGGEKHPGHQCIYFYHHYPAHLCCNPDCPSKTGEAHREWVWRSGGKIDDRL